MNIFIKRWIDFCYCNTYIPEIDDTLTYIQYQKNKLFIGNIFDVIILPIGAVMFYKKYKNIKGDEKE